MADNRNRDYQKVIKNRSDWARSRPVRRGAGRRVRAACRGIPISAARRGSIRRHIRRAARANGRVNRSSALGRAGYLAKGESVCAMRANCFPSNW